MSKEDAQIRLAQAIEYLRDNGKARTHQEIADAIGKRQPHVTSAINGDPRRLTKGFLRLFAEAYSDYINAEYLIDGTGPMERPARDTRPHIPTSVAAGFTDVAISTVAEKDVEHRPVIPMFPSYDFTIGVTGDSMVPMLADGDTIACRRVESAADIKPRHAYVLETTDGALVKEIASISPDTVFLHSLNPSYGDLSIASSTIISISQVVGIIRPVTP